MKFTIIEGGRGRPAGTTGMAEPSAEAVRIEAARRLREAGVEEAATRAFLTGRRVPPALAYFRLQIEFTADALARRAPIPADFRDDCYWPAQER